MADELALRQLVQRRGSPKIGIIVQREDIAGVTDGWSPTKAWFKQTANDMHLNVILLDKQQQAAAANAQRFRDLGDAETARQAMAVYANRCDYLLEVAVRGPIAKEQAELGNADWVGGHFLRPHVVRGLPPGG